MKNRIKILLNGIIEENPVWVLLLGTCPVLATSSSASSGVGMGIAVLFVLLGSNIMISALKHIIPQKVRIPSYIVIIAGFVTVISMLIQAFFPDLYEALGIFLPLIVVNCIILARAEVFASKNTIFNSILDAIGMGIGFTIALLLMGSVRELLGSGTWFGLRIISERFSVGFFNTPAGGFFVFGVLIAVTSVITGKQFFQSKNSCTHCPSRDLCHRDGTDTTSRRV